MPEDGGNEASGGPGETVGGSASSTAVGGAFAAPPPAPQRFTPHFMGTGGEYFRIWIVNVALTIATLGIYAAWAKVRTRRYFYSHTVVGGRPFDYLGQPKAILVGHIVIIGAIAVSSLFKNLYPLIGSVSGLGVWALFPFLMYKAHRFKAFNSSYRGIRFGFNGTVGEAYKVYLLIPVVFFAVTAGIGFLATLESGAALLLMPLAAVVSGFGWLVVYPFWVFKQKDYTFENTSYGTLRALFTPELKSFYRAYGGGLAIVVVVVVAAVLPFGAAIAVLTQSLKEAPWAGTWLAFVPILLVMSIFVLVQQYLYARITNHCWNSFRLGSLTFEADLSARTLVFIRLTNILAILATFGLAAPWARVRRTRYLVSCFTVIAPRGLEDISASQLTADSAVGDAAADFFDWDVGW